MHNILYILLQFLPVSGHWFESQDKIKDALQCQYAELHCNSRCSLEIILYVYDKILPPVVSNW